jgi:hypothetical protein
MIRIRPDPQLIALLDPKEIFTNPQQCKKYIKWQFPRGSRTPSESDNRKYRTGYIFTGGYLFAFRGRNRSPQPMKKLRLRGDWSDTGPNSRPETEIRLAASVSVLFVRCRLVRT